MSRIVLYQYGGDERVPSFSPPCLKIQMALRLLGLEHDVVNLSGPFAVKRKSPTGRVPAIVMDGTTIADSVFILDKLQQKLPDAEFWPREPEIRAIDRAWDCFATDTLYWQGFYLRWLVPENRKRVLEASFGAKWSLGKAVASTLAPILLKQRANGQGIGGRSARDVETSYRTSLATITDGLGMGPFLQSRKRPGRGDVAIASHVVQLTVGREDTPAARLRSQFPRLFDHVAATFEACGWKAP